MRKVKLNDLQSTRKTSAWQIWFLTFLGTNKKEFLDKPQKQILNNLGLVTTYNYSVITMP